MVVLENVLVSTISAPASKYLACISLMAWGWVIDNKSLLPCKGMGYSLNRSPLKSASVNLYCCSMVPMAPSSTKIRSCKAFLIRSEEHTSELQSRENLVCRLLLEKKKKNEKTIFTTTSS